YTTEYSSAPSAGADAVGNFVIVWSAKANIEVTKGDVFGQRYDRYGVMLGGEFRVSSLTTYRGASPRVAVNPSGEFVVVWIASDHPHSIWGQRYASTGATEGDQFLVNAQTTSYLGAPAVAWNGSGGFVVVWDRDFPGDADGAGIFGQRFTAAGALLGGEFQ